MTVESPTTTLAAYIRENISALRDLDFETAEQADTLRNARSFLEALAKILEGGEARTAFGLPRDWGHSSRIGIALYALHQHRPARGPYAVHMGQCGDGAPSPQVVSTSGDGCVCWTHGTQPGADILNAELIAKALNAYTRKDAAA